MTRLDPVAECLVEYLTGPLPSKLARSLDLSPARAELELLAVEWADLLQHGRKAQRGKAATVLAIARSVGPVDWWGSALGLAVARALPGDPPLTIDDTAALLGISPNTVKTLQRRYRAGGRGLPTVDGSRVPLSAVLDRIDNPRQAGRPPTTGSD